MISRLKRAWNALWTGPNQVRYRGSVDAPPPETPPLKSIRRWDAGKTHRLNAKHWSPSLLGVHINDDLAENLETLGDRCTFEASNNPFVEGVIKSHSLDLVTPSGPTLKIESSNPEFNRRVAEEWERWFTSPEIGGQISGVDLLRRWNGQLWRQGDIVALFVTDSDQPAGYVSLRMLDIDPRRLKTPYELNGDTSIALGVKRSKVGKPQQYFIERIDQFSQWYHTTGNFDSYSADDVLHAFESIEPGQVRGFPRLASCLEEIAQLRDYDTEVLDAARAAANNGAVASTDIPELLDSASDLPTSSITFERGQVKWLPPGWKLEQMVQRQPSAMYKDFRLEKLRGLGRSVHMPLLLILLSAEESNFSQSRIDVNVFYERGLKAQRLSMESMVLNPIFERFLSELRLLSRNGSLVIPPVPPDMKVRWHWEPMPQADELKHMQAKKLKRELHLSTPSQDMAELGLDFEKQVEQMKQDKEALDKAGLQLSPDDSSGQPSNPENQEEADADQETADA